VARGCSVCGRATLRSILEKLGATELDISSRHTRLAGQFDTNHKDPFDRLLAAQAVIEGVSLISKDEVMSNFPLVRVW
jgi:PIN domain nuclease of toxin-antitoxin system